jgi:hypothetical protein
MTEFNTNSALKTPERQNKIQDAALTQIDALH